MDPPIVENSSLTPIIRIKQYHDILEDDPSPKEEKFYSAIQGIEDIHPTDKKIMISADLSDYLKTHHKKSALSKKVLKYMSSSGSQKIVNLPELRQEIIRNIVNRSKISHACFDTLKIIRTNVQYLFEKRVTQKIKKLALDNIDVNNWAHAFVVLNYLSMIFVNLDMKLKEKTRAGWRRNFLVDYFNEIPLGLIVDNLPFSTEAAIQKLEQWGYPQEVQEVVRTSDDIHRLRNQITHNQINRDILQEYAEFEEGDQIFQAILDTHQIQY